MEWCIYCIYRIFGETHHDTLSKARKLFFSLWSLAKDASGKLQNAEIRVYAYAFLCDMPKESWNAKVQHRKSSDQNIKQKKQEKLAKQQQK